MNKQQLASKIWASANKMRSKIEANEYKDYILGFMFYKYLSEKEEKIVRGLMGEDDNIEDLLRDPYDIISEDFESLGDEQKNKLISIQDECKRNVKFIQQKVGGYFISYKNLFSTWIDQKNALTVKDVSDALSAFKRNVDDDHIKIFDKIFKTLSEGLTKLGDNAESQAKAIKKLINTINDIPMSDKRQEYDVLGFVYEYLISNFAANAGKKAGEFYTPHEVSLLMSNIVAHHLQERKEIRIYDPTSGSGSLLINIGKSIQKYQKSPDSIFYYAQEIKENTYNLTRMNLVMRGIKPSNIETRNADTLGIDWPIKNGEVLRVDAVVSNPPYSQAWEQKPSDVRFSAYGTAPKSKADYAFLLHDLYHIKDDGIVTIVLPHGVLFRGDDEYNIRKNLIENNNIDTIIGLPANIFFGTTIPTIIMVLKKQRPTTDVQIIDASKGFIKDGKNNKLRHRDIKKIMDVILSKENIDKFSKVVTRDEIRENDYNLNIPRYVDSSEEPEKYDIYATMFGGIPEDEINDFNEYREVFSGLENKLFQKKDDGYFAPISEEIENIISSDPKVNEFKNKFSSAFMGFDNDLKTKIIDNFSDVNIVSEKEIIADNLFNRFEGIKLVDRYDAYQLLADKWDSVSLDIEMMQSEDGYNACKKIDPNMVIKKAKKGEEGAEDKEVQKGWKGHILPFELVQKEHFSDELNKLTELNNKQSELETSLEEKIGCLSDEDIDFAGDALNEDNTEFVSKEFTALIKRIRLENKGKEIEEDSSEFRMLECSDIIDEIKETKKEIKNLSAILEDKTIEKVKSLTDDEVKILLYKKWIEPLCISILDLSKECLENFIKKIQALSEKYAITYSDVEGKIKKESKELSNMIDELTGNDNDIKGLQKFKSLLES